MASVEPPVSPLLFWEIRKTKEPGEPEPWKIVLWPTLIIPLPVVSAGLSAMIATFVPPRAEDILIVGPVCIVTFPVIHNGPVTVSIPLELFIKRLNGIFFGPKDLVLLIVHVLLEEL